MKRAYLVLVPILCMASCMRSLPADKAEIEGPVLQRLARVEQFTIGGVGIAGTISQGEKDFREILERPSAQEDFLKILERGNAQAQCYALLGLRTVARDEFDKISPSFANSKEEVMGMSGCIVYPSQLSEVVGRIAAGDYKNERVAQQAPSEE